MIDISIVKLQLYAYTSFDTTIKLPLYKYIGEQLNLKKHLKLKKLIINCYYCPYIGFHYANNIAYYSPL